MANALTLKAAKAFTLASRSRYKRTTAAAIDQLLTPNSSNGDRKQAPSNVYRDQILSALKPCQSAIRNPVTSNPRINSMISKWS